MANQIEYENKLQLLLYIALFAQDLMTDSSTYSSSLYLSSENILSLAKMSGWHKGSIGTVTAVARNERVVYE